jgi:vesicle-fusing ATPase
MQLAISKQTDSALAFTNLVYINPVNYEALKVGKPDTAANENQILIEFGWSGCRRGTVVFAAASDANVPEGKLALNGTQRDDVYVSLDTMVNVSPHRVTASSSIQSMTVSVELRQPPADGAAPLELDAAKLEKLFSKSFKGQVFCLGQTLLIKQKKTLLLKVTSIDFPDFELVGGVTGGGDMSRGQFTPPSSSIVTERASGANIKLIGGGSSEKGGARNIFNKSFDFNQMGIGGLDSEFNTIFKRAFASR